MFDNTRRVADGGLLIYAKSEVLIGTAVGSVPLWASWLHAGLSWFALICGSLVGAHGVWRIALHHLRRWHQGL